MRAPLVAGMWATASCRIDSTVASERQADATAAAMMAAPSWQKPASWTLISEARWVACAAACAGLQALTSPTGAMHMAELEQGMLPSAANRGSPCTRSRRAVCSTDRKKRFCWGPNISSHLASQSSAQSSMVA